MVTFGYTCKTICENLPQALSFDETISLLPFGKKLTFMFMFNSLHCFVKSIIYKKNKKVRLTRIR